MKTGGSLNGFEITGIGGSFDSDSLFSKNQN
jgi:hypothetical protein